MNVDIWGIPALGSEAGMPEAKQRRARELATRRAVAQDPPLTLAHYAAAAQQTDRFADKAKGIDKLRFGFFGEIGGLLSAVKKVNRDQLGETETEVAGEEIGDALWYLFSVAHSLNVAPERLGLETLRILRERFAESEQDPDGDITFRQLDSLVALHDQGLEAQRIERLGELARTSGELLTIKVDAQLELIAPHPTARLGELLALLAIVSSSFCIRLEDVAHDNLIKIHGRWPGDNRSYINLFDGEYLGHEQIPRVLAIEFIERGDALVGHVVQRLNGVFIGDRLTDNSNEPDDYRFHDVFHLAYIAHLGWSPVIRGLLKYKRKSRPDVDENEDGARAMIIEEGIATWIFNHAKKHSFYEDIVVGKLDYGLLKQVHSMVSGYEVDQCPLWQWELAILEGFRIFRELREHRGGTVHVDMLAHSIRFEPPKNQTP